MSNEKSGSSLIRAIDHPSLEVGIMRCQEKTVTMEAAVSTV